MVSRNSSRGRADAAAGMIIYLPAQSRNAGNLLSAPAP